MSDQPTTRQALYDRIRKSSKDEVILEEMIRLGFWPQEGQMPADPAEEIRRRGELERQLSDLQKEQSRLYNIESMKRDALKQRLLESRQKQKETKERREKERQARAAAWAESKAHDIVYLGEDVSGDLGKKIGDDARLTNQNLPVVQDAAQLAAAMGVDIGTLRWLAFHRKVAKTSHYVRFQIPKRTGGTRLISAPMPKLKAAQQWVLTEILSKVEVHMAAHGFRTGRSIVSNARPHVNRAVVVNVDLKDFFPSVTYPRIKGVFRALGYSPAVATLLALLCSEPDVTEVALDGVRYFVGLGERRLPQGAPTSPALTNVLCRRLDRRLLGAARKLGFEYTRYADDLTFSSNEADTKTVGRLLRQLGYIVGEEGFSVHPNKTRVLRKGRQQEVTGVVVNQTPTLARATLRKFRATLHHIDKDGPNGKHWGNAKNVMASIQGFANYVAMVHPEKGRRLQEQVRALHRKHKYTPPPPRVFERPAAASKDEKGKPSSGADGKPWWKFW